MATIQNTPSVYQSFNFPSEATAAFRLYEIRFEYELGNLSEKISSGQKFVQFYMETWTGVYRPGSDTGTVGHTSCESRAVQYLHTTQTDRHVVGSQPLRSHNKTSTRSSRCPASSSHSSHTERETSQIAHKSILQVQDTSKTWISVLRAGSGLNFSQFKTELMPCCAKRNLDGGQNRHNSGYL